MIQPHSSSDSPPDRNPTAAHFDVKGRARNEFAEDGTHDARESRGAPCGVLMLTHDPPRPPKGGGVRGFHCALELAHSCRLHLAILTPEDEVGLPRELADRCASVIWTPAQKSPQNFRASAPSAAALAWKALRTPLSPWVGGGADLLSVAQEVHTAPHRYPFGRSAAMRPILGAYAAILRAEAALGARAFGLPAARSMAYARAFRAIAPEIRRLVPANEIQILWIEFSFLFPFLPELQMMFPGTKVVCNAHNVEWRMLETTARVAGTKGARAWFDLEARSMRKSETAGFRACDFIFACSAPDCERISELAPGALCIELPNGVDAGHFRADFRPDAHPDAAPTLLFCGTMGYAPNADAVRLLLSDILPRIRRDVPDCRLLLAGARAHEHIGEFARGVPGVEVASDVPDMREYYARAWVFVVPLRAGSGTRLKILEALSMSRALVSTSIGAEGIAGLTPGVHCEIADAPEDFARAAVRLLHDPALRERMGRAGRALAAERYDWAILQRGLVESLRGRFPDLLIRPFAQDHAENNAKDAEGAENAGETGGNEEKAEKEASSQ